MLGVPAAIYMVLVVVMCFGEAVRGRQIDFLSNLKTVFQALLPFLVLLVAFELTAVQLWTRTGRFLIPGIITVFLLGGFILYQVRDDEPLRREEQPGWHGAEPGHMPPPPDEMLPPLPQAGDDRPESGPGPHPEDGPGKKNGNRPMSPEMMKSLLAILLVMADFGIVYARTMEDERKRIAELEKEKISQELQYLRNQINPHFFMNTLNNIHSLVDIDPEKAKDVIVELSKLMRYILYDSDQNLITYEKEAIPAAYTDTFSKVATVTGISPIKSSMDKKGGGPQYGSSRKQGKENKSGFGSMLDEECSKVRDDITVRTTGYARSGRPVNVNLYLHEYRK